MSDPSWAKEGDYIGGFVEREEAILKAGQETKRDDEPSLRDLIDWLGLFVAPMCKTRNDTMMYMNVRNRIIKEFIK
jgi:hypothetical protein